MPKKNTYILGISSDFHDSAAAIIKNGEILAAAQEERFTRKKHDESFPTHAIAYCLQEAKISGKDLDYVGFYEIPFLKFERLLMNYSHNFPQSYKQFSMAIPQWLTKKLWIESKIKNQLNFDKEILFIPHHLSHAASAFYCSGFEESAILTVDGVGEWDTTTLAYGKGNDIQMLQRQKYPHSLGLLYSAFTYYLGFKVNSAEYKVMGLAPYGQIKYLDKFYKIIKVNYDGSFELNMDYFSYEYDNIMITTKFDDLFEHPRRTPETQLDQFHFDIAKTLQFVLEDILVKTAQYAKFLTNAKNLCMAGGVALNCVANSKILQTGIFENIFIQPASGDAGGALGVALHINHKMLNNQRTSLKHVFLGPSYTNSYIEKMLKKYNITYTELSDKKMKETIALALTKGKIVGLFQDRMEYGPRALGNRSILADPRDKNMQKAVNQKIKFRESFRPFAPSVLEEDITKYFELEVPTPYMLLTAQTKNGAKDFPAVTHVDNSARIQSVNASQNKKYYDIIKEFKKLTGLGMVLNTSFNRRGEPIVRSPEEALSCFFGTHMDILALQNFLVTKEDNKDILFNPMSSNTKFNLD